MAQRYAKIKIELGKKPQVINSARAVYEGISKSDANGRFSQNFATHIDFFHKIEKLPTSIDSKCYFMTHVRYVTLGGVRAILARVGWLTQSSYLKMTKKVCRRANFKLLTI